MVHLMRAIDRALGYAFVADVDDTSATISPTGAPRTKVDNRKALFSSAASVFPDAPKVQDIQERWVDYRDEYDEWETGEWRREGMAISATKPLAKAKK